MGGPAKTNIKRRPFPTLCLVGCVVVWLACSYWAGLAAAEGKVLVALTRGAVGTLGVLYYLSLFYWALGYRFTARAIEDD